MWFLLGISFILNILFFILLFLIYRYSYSGLKNKVDNFLIKDFLKKNKDLEDFLNDSK